MAASLLSLLVASAQAAQLSQDPPDHAQESSDNLQPLKSISPSKLGTAPKREAARSAEHSAARGDMRSAAQSDQSLNRRPAPELGLMQAVRYAVEWHPSIAEAIGTLYQQGEQVNAAEAAYYPQVSGGIRSGYDGSYQGSRGSQALSISLKQVLYDFGKISSSVDIANARVARSQATILLNIDKVARDTSYAYVEAQRYKRLLDVADEQIKGIAQITDLATQRSDLGASTRSDVVQAKSREEGARATRLQYLAQYNRWSSTLANLVGRPTVFSVNNDFPQNLTQSCEAAQPDINTLPGILVAQAQRVEARASITQARAEGLPTLSLEPSVNQYLDSNYNNRDRDLERTQVGIFLNLNVPIYQGGATSARTAAAGHALTAADSAEDAARLDARQGLFEAQAQTSSLAQRLSSLQLRQRDISEARDLYQQQYLQLGTRPLLDLLNAEQEIHQSHFDLVNTVGDLRRLQIDCLYSTGSLRRAYQIDNSSIQGVEILP